MFLAILYSLDGRHVSNRQINASYMCVRVCLYICLWRLAHECPWNVDILWGGK